MNDNYDRSRMRGESAHEADMKDAERRRWMAAQDEAADAAREPLHNGTPVIPDQFEEDDVDELLSATVTIYRRLRHRIPDGGDHIQAAATLAGSLAVAHHLEALGRASR